MSEALRVLALVEVLGVAALPLSRVLLGRLPGGGAGFAKPLGLLLATWLAWLLGSVVPYGTAVAVVAVCLVVLTGVLLGVWPLRRVGKDPVARRLGWTSEAVFLAAFAGMLLVRSFAADVWGTEQPMDMALVTSVDRSGGFPPADPWLAGEQLDYYYLGHLAIALLSRLAGVGPDEGYNVGLALVFALTAVAVFSLVAGIAGAAGRAPARCGLAAVALVLVLGNLASAGALSDVTGSLRDYDWFGVSRVIPGTINEFPAFAFLLGDLHAHVLALPCSVLVLAWAAQLLITGPRPRDAVGAGVATGLLYAINSWSLPVAAGVVLLALVARVRHTRAAWDGAALWAAVFALVAVLAVAPFLGAFDSPARGVGIVGERRAFAAFLGDQAQLYGLLLWLVAAAFAGALLRARHRLRLLAWGTAAFALAGSALAAEHLTGALLVAILTGTALWQLLRPGIAAPERVVWLFVAAGLGCLLLPELVYVRDEFDGSDLFRMNTVFKLGFQAWLLLALAAAAGLPLAREWLGPRAWWGWALVAALLAVGAAVYPVAGPYARTAAFSDGPRVEGLDWLAAQAPGDVTAIAWLRDHAPDGAVVLESAGPDYSEFGHARISTFTGLPAVLGWAGHERQWGHDPGPRRVDVDRLYRTADVTVAQELLRRYGVRYVVVGPLERADHGDAGIDKWDVLGDRVFTDRGTVVWDVGATTAPGA